MVASRFDMYLIYFLNDSEIINLPVKVHLAPGRARICFDQIAKVENEYFIKLNNCISELVKV